MNRATIQRIYQVLWNSCSIQPEVKTMQNTNRTANTFASKLMFALRTSNNRKLENLWETQKRKQLDRRDAKQ